MQHFTHDDLYSLEEYARLRDGFRKQVMAHKKDRRVPVGPNAALYFEDRLTLQYQIQEMLRIERVFEPEGIAEELEAYNPLVPDGTNWKATFMIEYPDIDERRRMLTRLIGIDRATWVRVGDLARVFAISNEDLARETEDKTSAVHFMRFELTPEMIADAKAGADIAVGIEHENYTHTVSPLPQNVRASLVGDLD